MASGGAGGGRFTTAEHEPGALSDHPAIKSKKIRGRSALRPLDIAGLSQFLVQVSNLIVDCAEIQRLDIHPLLASGNEFTALDVTLDIAPFEGDRESRLAIRPYPLQLEEWVEMKNGERALFRPILPEDEPSCGPLSLRSRKRIFIIAILAKSTNLPTMI